MSSKRALDTGTFSTPTVRAATRTGMPAASSALDHGAATSTVARPNTFEPDPLVYTFPPSAPSAPGDL
jgi:hypothetical protein